MIQIKLSVLGECQVLVENLKLIDVGGVGLGSASFFVVEQAVANVGVDQFVVLLVTALYFFEPVFKLLQFLHL